MPKCLPSLYAFSFKIINKSYRKYNIQVTFLFTYSYDIFICIEIAATMFENKLFCYILY